MTSCPPSARARAAASPITPAPTTTASTSSTTLPQVQTVVPAKVGTHLSGSEVAEKWVPAFAGMTDYLADCEKVAQRLKCRVRRFLGEEMAAGDAMAADVFGVLAPHRQHVVAAALAAALALQRQQRHGELSAAVGAVVIEVDRRTGTVLVAGRPDRLRIAEA